MQDRLLFCPSNPKTGQAYYYPNWPTSEMWLKCVSKICCFWASLHWKCLLTSGISSWMACRHLNTRAMGHRECCMQSGFSCEYRWLLPRCLAVIVLSPTVSTAPAPSTNIHVLPLKNWVRMKRRWKGEGGTEGERGEKREIWREEGRREGQREGGEGSKREGWREEGGQKGKEGGRGNEN